MKKAWKITLGMAAAASLIPYSCKRDAATGAISLKALLWKYIRTASGQKQVIIALDLSANTLPAPDIKAEPALEVPVEA